MRRRTLLVLALLALSGCTTPAATHDATPLLDPAKDLVDEPWLIPQDRAVVASFTWREESTGSSSPIFASPAWGPRDVAVTYHGIQEVHDEFARVTQAAIFRVPEMVVTAHDVVSATGLDRTYQNEVHLTEYQFERSDGRLLSVVDLETGVRRFEDPTLRHPLASPTVFFMTLKALDGDFARRIPVWRTPHSTLTLHVDPYAGERPFAGDCVAWEASFHWDPAPPGTPAGTAAEGGERFRFCLADDSLVPVWLHRGDEDGAYTLERTTPAFALPPDTDLVTPPVAFDLLPWQPAQGLVDLLPNPILAPPREDTGTWARRLSDRVAALQLDPAYQQYAEAAGDPYLRVGVVGVGQFYLVSVGNITVPPLEAGVDESSVFFLGDGDQAYMQYVASRLGGNEEPDTHAPRPPSVTFDSFDGELPTDRLPMLVGDASLETQLAPFVPVDASSLAFSLFTLGDLMLPLYRIEEPCSADHDGRILDIRADLGAAWYLRHAPKAPDCAPPYAASAPLPWVGPGHNGLMPASP